MKSSSDPADLERYLGDESRLPGGSADEVFWPDSPAEAAEALAIAASRGAPATFSGAGTGITGGRVPAGGVVVATDRLLRLEPRVAADGAGGTLLVGAGVALAAAQKAAADEGMWYPPDPTENGAFVGGTIATNASGARTFRFGPTRRWVRRIVVALADGSLLDLARGQVAARDGRFEIERPGRPRLVVPAPDWPLPCTTKHAAGYYSAPGMDLVDLFVGSEGTLGCVVEAELELIKAPASIISGILFFAGERAALAFVAAARGDRRSGERGVTPTALEFFDAAALALLRGAGADVPGGARAAIFFEQPVRRDDDADALVEAWATLAEERGADEASWLSQEPAEQQKFREFRHLVPVTINETIARRGVRKVSTDTAVPPGRAGEMLAAFRALLDGAGLESVAFGHIGDDHVHVNILPRDPSEQAAAKALYGKLVRAAVALGGTVSAEHGLGKVKAGDLSLLYPPETVARMRAVKTALDPLGLLGRGTLFG